MKTKKILYSLLILLITAPGIYAQNSPAAVKVIDNMLNLLNANVIKTNFVLLVKEPSSSQAQKVSGDFTLKKNKFILNSNQINVYFDGKTQWSYMPDVNEVSITNPTEKELAQSNPIGFMMAYKNKSDIKFAKINNSKIAHAIELTPKTVNADFKKILVMVNKSTNYPLSIQLTDKKGMVSTMTLSQFKSDLKIGDNSFIFNPKKYKDVEINDLR